MSTSQQLPPDPFAALESMMSSVPGGSYLVAMLRNNPDAQAALRSIDPARPETYREGMRRLLGVFGMAGPMADAMLDQAMSTMSDPAAMQQMAAQHGVSIPAGPPLGAPSAAPPTAAADVLPEPISAPPARDANRPPWAGLAGEVALLIAEGSERTAFEKITAALDDPRASAYDPRAGEYDDLTALIEVFGVEAELAGRQIPVRFASLFSRAALFAGLSEPAPEANPEFSGWCAEVGDALAGDGSAR